tara:strand:- start:337 stop:537 length:201 start_codon:yes stop_codon:yes gene_type:complete
MPFTSSRFIAEPIHRNTEHPGLKSASLLVTLSISDLANEGNKSVLADLLSEFSITALTQEQCIDAW